MDRSVLCSPQKNCPALHPPSRPGCVLPALGNPLEQDTGSWVQSLRCRAWKWGRSLWDWGSEHRARGMECRNSVVTAMPCAPCSSSFIEERGAVMEQVSGLFKNPFLFIALTY